MIRLIYPHFSHKGNSEFRPD